MLQSGRSPQASGSHDSPPFFSGPRGLAVKVLSRVEQSDAYLDKLLGRELASGELNDADRRLLNELATGVMRWQARLDWVLTGFYHGEFAKCLPVVRNALRVALYQILFLDRIPHSAAVNESVEIVKRLKGARSASVVNGVLRSVIRKLGAISYPERTDDVARYLSIMSSHPLWLVRRWYTRFGELETAALLEANNRRPRLALRVNPRRGTVDDAIARLEQRGMKPDRSEHVPGMIVLDGFGAIGSDAMFREGWFTVQDEGAALAAGLARVEPGMRVIDLCAAPGGKTTALAERMQDRGEIVAVDKFEAKLKLVQDAAERLGCAGMITTLAADARSLVIEPADVVLVDAPCSGLGVLAKKPDIKWKRTQEDLEGMAAMQRAILQNAARLVAPGGALIYSTCTIEPIENEEIVRAFLESNPEFELEPPTELDPSLVHDGFLRTLPHRHGIDGTFGARLRRR